MTKPNRNEALDKAIENSGLKKKAIAFKIGVHSSILSRYLSGKYAIPDHIKRRLADLLRQPMKKLF